jgi:hypothetical protein
MKRAFLLAFICLFVSSFSSFAQTTEDQKQQDEKRRKLIRSLSLDSLDLAIQTQETDVQEQVSVEAEEYPGLNMDFESPAKALRSYKPYTKQELQAYSDLLVDYSLLDYDRSETARPHKPARLFRTTIPVE